MEIPPSLERWLTSRRLRVDALAMRRRPESRNPTLLCRDASGARVFVKAAVERDPGVAHEQVVLRALAAVPTVPRVLHESPGVLALRWVEGRTLWDLRRKARQGPGPDAEIGAALARVQIAGRAAVASHLVKGDLGERLLWTSPEFFASLGPASLTLFRQVQSNRAAMDTLMALRQGETGERALLVHGDLRQPNIMVHRGQVTFVDWELCGLGDPARDLGMLLAEDVRAWLLPRDEAEVQSRAALEQHGRALLGGWKETAEQLGYPVDEAHATRVAGWAGEALLRAAYTLAHHEARVPQVLVDAAVAMLAAPGEWIGELVGPGSPRLRSDRTGELPSVTRVTRSVRAESRTLQNPQDRMLTRPLDSGLRATHVAALTRCLSRLPWEQLPASGSLAAPALAEWLYGEYFIGWRPPAEPRREYSGSPWFVAQLNARCARALTFEPGFRVTKRVEGGAFVENADSRLWVPALSALRPRSARVGQEVAVAMPCVREAALPGFFTIVSRAGRLDSAAPHLKFYVHATPAGAVALLSGLLRRPSLRTARFEAKVTNDPAHFGRQDTLLVYVTPKHAHRVAQFLLHFARSNPRSLRGATPPMTFRLAPGLAIAESPGHHAESFGAHRCRLVAEGLLTARAEGTSPLAAVAARFERAGLHWDRPWFGALPRGWLTRLGG